MPQDRSDRRLTFGFLCVSPFLVFIVVCVRALRIPGVYQGIAAVLVTAMTVAAWTLGARAIGADTKERQWLALSGGLLVVPWSVLALVFPGLGVPQQATEAENQLRYLALLLAGILMTGGFVTLTETLREAGERFYSALGFTAVMLAGPLFLVWNLFKLTVFPIAMRQVTSSGQMSGWPATLQSAGQYLLVVQAVLTYVATAAFAAALGELGWLGRTSSRVFAGVSLFVILCQGVTVAVLTRTPGDPTAVTNHWYAIPGMVGAVPALPLIMPFLFGVVLLRRAGIATADAAA